MAIDDCLKQLKLDYIDMMLIHWPQGYAEKMGLGNLPKVNFTEQ
jgi:diketogulonate reductase-like aldo/keto reductase